MDPAAREEARKWVEELDRHWSAEESAAGGPVPDPEARRRIIGALRQALEQTPVSGAGLERTALDYLIRLAHHFSGEAPKFESAGQIHAFCERLRRSVALLVGEVKELMTGRRAIQNEWWLYSSALSGDQDHMTRHIRLDDLRGGLGRMLFDWRSHDFDAKVHAELKEAIDELKHHQLAFMAGYRRSVRDGTISVLGPLSPEALERDLWSGGKRDDQQPDRPWKRLIPLRGVWLWRIYRHRYERLLAEDPQWFENRFLPSFREGYREYMIQAKAKSAPEAERGKDAE